MIKIRTLNRLRRDQRGATAVEFAFVLMPMMVFLLGGLDVGYQAYASSVMQGVLQETARKGAFESASTNSLETYAKSQLNNFAGPGDISLNTSNFRSFTNVGKAEKITTDTSPIGTFNLGDCFLDEQTNGSYDAAMSGRAGLGSAEYVVKYTLNMSFDRLSPIASYIGMADPVVISRSTLVRNEPFAGVVPPPTVCTVAP